MAKRKIVTALSAFLFLSAAIILFSSCSRASQTDRLSEAGKVSQTDKVSTSQTDKPSADIIKETPAQFDERMEWWREARFGLFIHWGLYAVPAGEWKDSKGHGEWILDSAHIPVDEYEKFAPQFNPTKFNAAEWVSIAKAAGMKYIVITSKHHDGFCLWDSKLTNYDVMDATPFKRDILRELTDECSRQGVKMCFYHSIMDWHHPDYLPRRQWEKRSSEGADLERYVNYMKGQVAELITNYGPLGILWFDGEWESSWNSKRGDDLYMYVRSLQPSIIVNNRVSTGRSGMAGTYDPKQFVGDYGTPEQEIPATGLAYDWETCMTMNNHWGYNKYDDHWKSTEDLIRKLIDIASKGGNFLLNVGPTAEGTFPQPSIERLKQMGDWLRVNGQSIYGTKASIFEKLSWGRCTTKTDGKGTTLYLHVFDWPKDGRLVVPGLVSKAAAAYLLARPGQKLAVEYDDTSVIISVGPEAPDPIASVVVMELKGRAQVVKDTVISAESDVFCRSCTVKLVCDIDDAKIRYTLDGSEPTAQSPVYGGPITITDTTTLKCRTWLNDKPVSMVAKRTFTRATPAAAADVKDTRSGLQCAYYTGEWDRLPDFSGLTAEATSVVPVVDLKPAGREENYALVFTGYVEVPSDDVYNFYLSSDDGSKLWIDGRELIDNDGLHAPAVKSGMAALAAGKHAVKIEFFQRLGGVELGFGYEGPGIARQNVPAAALSY